MEQVEILIAESDRHILEKLAAVLESAGYKVIPARNGKDAFQLFRQNAPDIIISDLHLPVFDGYEFLKTVVVESPEIPVIVISDEVCMEDVVFALQNGAWDHITKPVKYERAVIKSVENALRHQDNIKHNRRYQEILEDKIKNMILDMEQKKVELEKEIRTRKIIELRIEQAKQEWERTIDALPDMIALLDRNQTIIRSNRAFADYMGKRPQDLVGKKCHTLMRNQKYPYQFCPMTSVMKDGKPIVAEEFDEESSTHFEVSYIPYLDPDGTIIGIVHALRDISRRKKMENEKEQLQANLLHAQKMESIGQLASGIAHEINTPTQYIASNLDFLLESFQDIRELIAGYEELWNAAAEKKFNKDIVDRVGRIRDQVDCDFLVEEIPKALEQSKDGTDRVTKIVRGMKEFSYPGNKEKNPEDINKIIENTVMVSRNEWKYSSELQLDLDQELPQVSCLRDEMGQVILNMVVNAAQAVRDKIGPNPEGEKGLISISTGFNGSQVKIEIADNGTGMSDEVKNRIFDPFFTTKTVGKGTGQGLSIVHDVVVEKHNGNIYCESELGEGSTFIIELPL